MIQPGPQVVVPSITQSRTLIRTLTSRWWWEHQIKGPRDKKIVLLRPVSESSEALEFESSLLNKKLTSMKFDPPRHVILTPTFDELSASGITECASAWNTTAIWLRLDGWNTFHQLALTFPYVFWAMSTFLPNEDIRNWVPIIDDYPIDMRPQVDLHFSTELTIFRLPIW